MSATYVIGDIHGHYAKLVRLLRDAALIDEHLNWQGGTTALWFVGDFFDRGPDGIGAVELVMRLQEQARTAGGSVRSLLGNHDLLLLAAYRFGSHQSLIESAHQTGDKIATGDVDMFTAGWLRNGGALSDMVRLKRRHVAWLSQLPALAHEGDKLLAHADALLYLRCGRSVPEVNDYFRSLTSDDDRLLWNRVLDAFSEHQAFMKTGGTQRARHFLDTFGGSQLIHGHTPINKGTNDNVTEALVYADGLCVNVDAGMYLGSDGFIHALK